MHAGQRQFRNQRYAPESSADGVHYPGTYAAGCYNRLSDDIGGRTVENESMVNLPNWLDLRFAVEDDNWVDMSQVQVLQHRSTLDLRRGVLSRQVRFVDAGGRCTSVLQSRFVHMARPHLAGLRTVFTAEDWSGRLRVGSRDFAVSSDQWAGVRDRSWGIRPVGDPEPPGRAAAERLPIRDEQCAFPAPILRSKGSTTTQHTEGGQTCPGRC